MKNSIIISLLLIFLLIVKKTSSEKLYNLDSIDFTPDTSNKNEALDLIENEYGKNIRDWVNRIYILETANYTSGQYKKTGTPGMEITPGSEYPWGWYATARNIWSDVRFKPVGILRMKENQTGIEKQFIILPSVHAGMKVLADYLQRGNRPGRWYSTMETKQDAYEEKLRNIKVN